MATITTDTFLDDGTARTAGETWTINGCTLTVRTDTRWHVGSPAGMLGALGQVSTSNSLGGTFHIDGTKVRWMPFDTGLGTVPAIGTSVTQGGVSGYLLGVWADYTSAPTAVGSDMPASGYIKFREVTGGTFTAGPLSGISANASSPDVVGWIEVAATEGVNLTLSGCKFSTISSQGAWFNLGSTTGTAGQVIQVPTNGGGALSTIAAIQIETSPGSGIFEWYPVLPNTSTFVSASTLASDIRAKFVHFNGNGQAKIGITQSGSTCGYVPPAGCMIRCPNIFLRGATSAARNFNALNATLSSRVRANAGNLYKVSMKNVMSDWYISATSAGSTELSDSCFQNQVSFTTPADNVVLSNLSNGYSATGTLNSSALLLSSTFVNGTVSINNIKLVQNESGSPVSFSNGARNIIASNVDVTYIHSNLGSAGSAFSFATDSDSIMLSDVFVTGCGTQTIQGFNHTISNYDYTGPSVGVTQTTPALSVFNLQGSGIKIDGVTLGKKGVIADVNPYGSYVSSSGALNCTLRNFGTTTSFLQHRTAAQPQSFFSLSTNSFNIKVQRIFIGATRSSSVFGTGGSTVVQGSLFESVYGGNNVAAIPQMSSNQLFRNVQSPPTTSVSSFPGYSFASGFSNLTTGYLQFIANTPSEITSQYVTISVNNELSGFSGQGNLRLKNVGEYVIFETPFEVKGHTSFANIAPTVNPISMPNLRLEYSLDTGSGFSDWKLLSAANLSAESVSPSGFKMRLKVSCITANTSNVFNYVNVVTNTSVSDQVANLYPLDTNTLTFTNLVPGSEVRCYTGSDPATAVEIGGTESSGTSFSFTHSSGGSVGFIRIFALGYQPFNYDPYTYQAADTTLLVQQVIDRNYVNP
jgi:hypothetical protein